MLICENNLVEFCGNNSTPNIPKAIKTANENTLSNKLQIPCVNTLMSKQCESRATYVHLAGPHFKRISNSDMQRAGNTRKCIHQFLLAFVMEMHSGLAICF